MDRDKNMNNTFPNNSQKTSKISNLGLTIGVYLSILATGLLMILVFIPISIAIQQVIVVIIGLLFFVSLSIFVNITNPKKEVNLLDKYQTYFDNRIISYNYNGDSYYNNKQNLVEAAEEIKNLMDTLSKNYDESPVDISTIDADLLKRIETIEEEIQENLTEKETIITAQAIEEIEQNVTLKNRLIQALKAGGEEALRQLLQSNPIYNVFYYTNSFGGGFAGSGDNVSGSKVNVSKDKNQESNQNNAFN
jgi:hypothetical protein